MKPASNPRRFTPGASAMMSNLGGPEIPTGTSSFGFFDRRGWQFEQRAPLAVEGGFVKEIWATADPEFRITKPSAFGSSKYLQAGDRKGVQFFNDPYNKLAGRALLFN
jgi:hypothetical protein